MPIARPILFSSPMVRALLDGTKTQTRRLAKFSPCEGVNLAFSGLVPEQFLPGRWNLVARGAGGCWNARTRDLNCPYGTHGDLLWVRETCRAEELTDGNDGVRYQADNVWRMIKDTQESAEAWSVLYDYAGKRGAAVPGIHMPRWASRLTLRLTDVSAQRLRDISEADAIAEGTPHMSDEVREDYAALWNRINTKPGTCWADNPWVWAVSFEVHKANVDTVLAQLEAA